MTRPALTLDLRPLDNSLSLSSDPACLSFDFAPALRGDPGVPGPAGGAAYLRQSAGPVSALRVVWEDAAGSVRPLDYRDAAHIALLAGITTTGAAGAGQSVTVQRAGPLDAAGLGLSPGRVWLGIDGALTQSPPADGFDVLVGVATAAQRLYLVFSESIDLEQ